MTKKDDYAIYGQTLNGERNFLLTDFLNQPGTVVPAFLRVSAGFDDKEDKVIGLLLLSLPQETNMHPW